MALRFPSRPWGVIGIIERLYCPLPVKAVPLICHGFHDGRQNVLSLIQGSQALAAHESWPLLYLFSLRLHAVFELPVSTFPIRT